MIITSTRAKRPEPQPWRRTLEDMPVIYQWWYDTVAILAEYDDSEEGTLPSGALIREVERDIGRDRVLCDLKNPRTIEKAQLPKGRVRRLAPFCRATPIQVELVIDDLTTKTEIVQQVGGGQSRR